MKLFFKSENVAFELKPHPENYLPQIAALDQSLMDYAWSDKLWHNELLNSFSYLALIPEKGFLLFENNPNEDTLHLLKIAVSENERGTGIAKYLFEEFLELITQERGFRPKVYLEVECKNSRAIAFYTKLGFKKLHVKKKYYSDGKDALSMIFEH